jgi:hypothetical protein
MFGPDGADLPAQPLSLTPEDEAMKRPPNAFILFCRAVAPAVTSANPGMSHLDVNHLLGKMWQVSDKAAKSYYREQARQLMDSFKASHPDYYELRHKRQHTRTTVKAPEPIRIRVVLDGGEPTPVGPPLADDPLALLKMVHQQNPPNPADIFE